MVFRRTQITARWAAYLLTQRCQEAARSRRRLLVMGYRLIGQTPDASTQAIAISQSPITDNQ
jgi:hypothetical protein